MLKDSMVTHRHLYVDNEHVLCQTVEAPPRESIPFSLNKLESGSKNQQASYAHSR